MGAKEGFGDSQRATSSATRYKATGRSPSMTSAPSGLARTINGIGRSLQISSQVSSQGSSCYFTLEPLDRTPEAIRGRDRRHPTKFALGLGDIR